MFRAQANPMDDAVVKATDENLTSENWEYILDVCDRVSATPSGPSNAISSLLKRLAHRNANVQLYTLELANSLSQNCGAALHRELASKAFTDALLRLAGDRNAHPHVKQKVVERMGTWTEEFRNSPDLGIMEQAYQRLRQQQPGLMPPSKPAKAAISGDERRKEDEELQMALALSVQDKGAAGASPEVGGQTVKDDSEQMPAQNPQAQQQQGTTAATVSRVRALYDFTPSEAGELAFRKDDVIAVLESVYKDWWKGSLRGQTGIFPLNYVEKLQDPTKDELERDAQMEADVFGEIKNVEKLLALLSVRGEGAGAGRRGEREEEEISELYQRTLGIRPKLIELIGKYSQKKDDFTQLNEKFIKARRDYEALLESSMSQPQPQYQQQYPIRQRQPSYPPQHQQPYRGPQQGGYPGGPQDPAQRFYSPAPTEAGQQPGYGVGYPPSAGPVNGGSSAPFHFIPGGIQPPSQEIRRKPSPAGPLPTAPTGPNDPYGAAAAIGGPGGFQGQIRPDSIRTLNSGNPQELGTGGYESPVENRHSYPPGMEGQQGQEGGYEAYPPQAYQQQQGQQQAQQGGYPALQHQQQQQPPHTDPNDLPRPLSFEGQPQGGYAHAPQQPSAPPPGVPQGGVPSSPSQGFQQPYQAYPPQGGAPPSAGQGGQGGGDPGDYYR